MNISAELTKVALTGTVSNIGIAATVSPRHLSASLRSVAILGGINHGAISVQLSPVRLDCILAKGHNREVEAEKMAYSKRVDTVGDIIYTGEAAIGTQEHQPLWRLKRTTMIDDGEDVKVEYADGNGNFDNVWEDRLNKTYS